MTSRVPARWRGPATSLALVALLAAAACGADPPPALVVGEIAFSEDELGALPDAPRSRLAMLTAFGAAVAGGDLERVGRPFIERDLRSRLLRQLALDIALERAGVDDGELRVRYRSEPEYELEVRHILFQAERWQSDSVHAAQRAAAERALDRARGRESFAELAAELSDEPGADARGGRIQPGRRGSWVEPFWEAASSLEEGAVSDVVRTQYGYHIIRLEDRRIVPLEEVRHRVIDRLVDLDAHMERGRAWADSVAGTLRVHEDVVQGWRAGDGADSVTLVSWPGGAYRAAEFRDYLITLDADARERVDAAPLQGYATVVRGAARNALLAEQAAARGVELPGEVRGAVERAWLEPAGRWGSVLGFREGQSPDRVKRTALEALATERQEARIAREEVLALEPALRTLYRVRTAPDAQD